MSTERGAEPGAEELDLACAFVLDPEVALRPEPFGALAYHYGNRRLTFLRSAQLVAVVERLGLEESAASALRACGIPGARWPAMARALATLERSEIIRRRQAPPGA